MSDPRDPADDDPFGYLAEPYEGEEFDDEVRVSDDGTDTEPVEDDDNLDGGDLDGDDPGGDVGEEPDGTGRRASRRAYLRRRRRLRRLAVVVGIVVVAIGVRYVPWEALRPAPPVAAPSEGQSQSASPAPAVEQDTLLLIRTQTDEGPAVGITLLAVSAEADGTAVIFVPHGTLVDIPGFGLDRLGLAQQYGGTALVEASMENLLGIDIDHSAQVSDSGLSALLARTGGLDLEVDERLVARSEDGSAQVRFEPGAQFLDGQRLVEFWSFQERGESELDTFPRQQQVWGQLLRAASEPAVVEALIADGAPQLETSADRAFLKSLLTRMAAAATEGTMDYTLVPVVPFGAGDDTGGVTYRADPEGIERLVAGPLAPSVPVGGGSDAIRIQVLNGVGTPGIGQAVDRKLEGAGYRIVLTDNARSFDFNETRILVYREDAESLQAAEEVQRLLGVGTIQISRQPQSVVDLTIVVGADFAAQVPGNGDIGTESEEQTS